MTKRIIARLAVLLAVSGGLIVAAVFVLPPSVYIRDADYYCRYCGARLHEHESGAIGSSRPTRLERTVTDSPLSRWVGAHLAGPCEHDWQFISLNRRRYVALWGIPVRQTARIVDQSPPPALLDLPPAGKAKLEELLDYSQKDVRNYLMSRLFKDRLPPPPPPQRPDTASPGSPGAEGPPGTAARPATASPPPGTAAP